jgi:hypothetical protein
MAPAVLVLVQRLRLGRTRLASGRTIGLAGKPGRVARWMVMSRGVAGLRRLLKGKLASASVLPVAARRRLAVQHRVATRRFNRVVGESTSAVRNLIAARSSSLG